MAKRTLHDGRSDGLVPLESLDLARVDSFAGLLRGMAHTAFSGRQLGAALDILLEMAQRPNCRKVLTISGAMTVAKQGQIFSEMIDRGLVDAVICTGALMAHGLTESIGLTHYRHDPSKDDTTLFEQGYNRIYDTLEMESNLNDVAKVVRDVVKAETPDDGVWSSARLCRALGKRLDEMDDGPGILRSAYLKNVPVFVPALTDSELGLDVAVTAIGDALQAAGKSAADLSPDELYQFIPRFNPFLDLLEYTRLVCQTDEIGIVTIGGGVPRNWAQQVGPFVDITNHRLGSNNSPPRFRYGVRICPEPVHWGGLSGCTYSEGVSWGKFVPLSEGGRFAEVYADATLALPLLMKAVFEELDARK
ncbi:MAG: deoxyhypusine synthase family protein [Planctomycetales bacterium]|nr:deoxyhypusine synthase family protein [Planctomycetales bacterium]